MVTLSLLVFGLLLFTYTTCFYRDSLFNQGKPEPFFAAYTVSSGVLVGLLVWGGISTYLPDTRISEKVGCTILIFMAAVYLLGGAMFDEKDLLDALWTIYPEQRIRIFLIMVACLALLFGGIFSLRYTFLWGIFWFGLIVLPPLLWVAFGYWLDKAIERTRIEDGGL